MGRNQSKLEKTCNEHTQREDKMYILVAGRIATSGTGRALGTQMEKFDKGIRRLKDDLFQKVE